MKSLLKNMGLNRWINLAKAGILFFIEIHDLKVVASQLKLVASQLKEKINKTQYAEDWYRGLN